MTAGEIYYQKREQVLVIRFIGTIRVLSRESGRLTAALECLIRSLADDTDFNRIILDLTETTSIDSTNLGLIAQIARLSLARLGRRATLVSSKEDLNTLLESIGFEEVFDLVSAADIPKMGLAPLPGVEVAQPEQARLMLEAHRALAAMNLANEASFRNVIELLERETQAGGQARP